MLARALISALLLFAPDPGRDPLAGLRRRPEARARVLATYAAIDAATDSPEVRLELRRVCARESWCGRYGHVGPHAGDAAHGGAQWAAAVARGWLDPETCPEHRDAPGRFWSTRGAFGMSAAYALRYLPGCVAPSALDHVEHAAVAAAEHVEHLKAIGARSCVDRVRAWVGPGRWAELDPLTRIRKARKQCGREALPVTLLAVATLAAGDVDVVGEARERWTQ